MVVSGKQVMLAKEQAGLNNAATCGQIIELFITELGQEQSVWEGRLSPE